MRKHSKQQGFSLIELLIVVAIILIIAAIAIPNLVRAKMSANESSAAAAVRSIGTAQVQYASTYNAQGFADTLVHLGTGASTNPATPCPTTPSSAAGCLVDGVLTAGAAIGKSGYFIDTAGQGALPMQTFVTQAGPIVYNRTGLSQFCGVEDGVLHKNPNSGGAGGALPTFTYAQCSTAAAPWIAVAN